MTDPKALEEQEKALDQIRQVSQRAIAQILAPETLAWGLVILTKQGGTQTLGIGMSPGNALVMSRLLETIADQQLFATPEVNPLAPQSPNPAPEGEKAGLHAVPTPPVKA